MPTTDRTPTPQPAQPFNRRLLAHGRSAPPSATLRADDHRHFVLQEYLGVLATLAVFFAIAYGVTREFVRPLLLIGAVAAAIAVVPVVRARRRRNAAKTQPARRIRR